MIVCDCYIFAAEHNLWWLYMTVTFLHLIRTCDCVRLLQLYIRSEHVVIVCDCYSFTSDHDIWWLCVTVTALHLITTCGDCVWLLQLYIWSRHVVIVCDCYILTSDHDMWWSCVTVTALQDYWCHKYARITTPMFSFSWFLMSLTCVFTTFLFSACVIIVIMPVYMYLHHACILLQGCWCHQPMHLQYQCKSTSGFWISLACISDIIALHFRVSGCQSTYIWDNVVFTSGLLMSFTYVSAAFVFDFGVVVG